MNGEPSPGLLATAATFPQMKRALSGDREMPKRSELVDYNYAVAGHAGTLCDADGELFIKPCTKSEINFYESAHELHPDFADLMPLYYGSLSLTENTTDQMIHDAIPAIVENADVPAAIKEEVQSHLHLDQRSTAPVIPELQRAATDGVTWVPNKSRKITTDRAVVLHNSSFGFKKPNIMDAKLGLRLWADDAPLQKRERFDEIANSTTHKKYGFRVAGMRVYKGSADPTELDEEGFKVYDKYWGRDTVTEENVLDMLKAHFIFNKRAGIDEELGKLVAQAFLADLQRVQEVLESHESRMYSSSLLFVFEGDGKALRAAMEEKTALVQDRETRRSERAGIGMDDDGQAVFTATVSEVVGDEDGSEISFESEDFSSEPSIYSLKLIDFAHAKWVPGQGPDENVLLGAAPAASTTSASASTLANISLQPFWEYRFQVPFSSSLNIRLVSGLAEKEGTELAPNVTYTFSGTKSKINTWQGCELEVSTENAGSYEAHVAELTAEDTPLVSYLNLHMKLQGLRAATVAGKSSDAMGPRVLVVGPPNSGKTSLVKMLTGWATRMGKQPLVVNTDASQGMLSMPGTLTAAVFATLMDMTTDWGGTPSSGPAGIPVKLPLTYYYGLERPRSNPKLFRGLLSRLAAASTNRLSEDPEVRSSGMLIDTGAVDASEPNYDMISHIAAEFSVNVVVSLGSERIAGDLSKVFGGQKTSLGEDVIVVGLEKSGGIVERDPSYMQQHREKVIKEYFFGDLKRTLSPATQNIGFEGISLWKVVEADQNAGTEDFYDPLASTSTLEKVEPSLMMLNCTLAIMYASPRDHPDAIRDANVMGFVYITDVDEKKKRLKVLSPVNARLGDRPLVWGNWPEPMVSLLG